MKSVLIRYICFPVTHVVAVLLLSTAASIWTSSAIGIMVGVGFYGAAISLALLSVCLS